MVSQPGKNDNVGAQQEHSAIAAFSASRFWDVQGCLKSTRKSTDTVKQATQQKHGQTSNTAELTHLGSYTHTVIAIGARKSSRCYSQRLLSATPDTQLEYPSIHPQNGPYAVDTCGGTTTKAM